MIMITPLRVILLGAVSFGACLTSQGIERYVSPLGANIAPFTDWSTAATNIQDAIDASSTGDVVWVTNGVYATGGKVAFGNPTNRVVLDKALTVQSINGPTVTTIQGASDPATTNGPASVRCAWVADGAILRGFTLCGGTSPTDGGGAYGGGPTTNAILSHCVIVTNIAAADGGGAYRVVLLDCTLAGNRSLSKVPVGGGGGSAYSRLTNCVVVANSALSVGGGSLGGVLRNCAIVRNDSWSNGGGVSFCSLWNCTVTGNRTVGSSKYGGGCFQATLTNCVVYGNNDAYLSPGSNYYGGTLSYSCSSPLPTGPGNIELDPQLFGDIPHLAATSPCRGSALSLAAAGVDIDGQAWANPPSMGCDEWAPPAVVVGQPRATTVGFPLALSLGGVAPAGQEPFGFWWSKDGAVIEDGPHYNSVHTTNLVVKSFGPADAGIYQVVASNAFGMSTSALTRVVVRCVDVAGIGPVQPYLDWGVAATDIQAAIDVAGAGDFVLVTNGLYASGGLAMAGDLTNRVVITKALTVASINGPVATIIQGARDPVLTNGPLAVRCAWLTSGAVLHGFTLTGGATRTNASIALQAGGGTYTASNDARVVGCILSNNAAQYGGGAYWGQFENCWFLNNWSGQDGGAAWGGSALLNCLAKGNRAVHWGGGLSGGTATNCTVTGNSATVAGGCFQTRLMNSIVYSNSPMFSDNIGPDAFFSCALGLRSTNGNITAPPELLDGVHLSATSPCRGAGNSLCATGTDLDGMPWVNPPSMGCYEFYETNFTGPLSVQISSTWPAVVQRGNMRVYGQVIGQVSRLAWSFGDGSFLTNASMYSVVHAWADPGDYTVTFTAYNADHPDGVSTNLALQVLPLVSPTLSAGGLSGSAFSLSFPGQPGGGYVVEKAEDMTPPASWQALATVYSTGSVMTVTDTRATNTQRFYRVRIP